MSPRAAASADETKQRRRRFLAHMSLAALLLGAGLALGAIAMLEGPYETGEFEFDLWLSTDREGPIVWLATAVHFVLGPIVGPILTVVAGVAIARWNRRSGLLFVAITAVSWLSVACAKLAFHRQRPPGTLLNALIVENGNDSFPSGHTAFAAGVSAGVIAALWSARRPTRRAWIAGGVLVVLTALSRLYLGVHYWADVVAAPLFVGGTALAFVTVLQWFGLVPDPSDDASGGGTEQSEEGPRPQALHDPLPRPREPQ